MTIALLILGACVAAFILIVVLLPDELEPVQLGSPRVKYLVIAEDYAQACALVDKPRHEWRFIHDTSDLLGYKTGDVEFLLVGRWAHNPIFNDPWAYQRLRSLGLTAYPEYDQTL